jgi:hypothetical protein
MEGVDLSKYDFDAKIDGQGSVQLTFGATYMTEYNEVIAKIQSAKSVFAFKDGQNFFFVILPRVKEEYSLDMFKKDLGYCLSKGGFLD